MLDADRPPDAPWVPVGIEAVPVLEDTCQIALRRAIRLRRARQLDRERVLATVAGLLTDLERVREEVPLRVAEVRAVEPHVALVEEPVEREPRAGVVAGRIEPERSAVQQGTVRVGERRARAPVARDVDRLPPADLVIRIRELPTERRIGDSGLPGAGEIEVHAPILVDGELIAIAR